MTRILKTIALAGSVCLLTACSVTDNFKLLEKREESLKNITGNIWQYDAVWPWEDRAIKVREYLSRKATEHCAKSNMGSQPVDAVSGPAEGGQGSRATLVFRCVDYMAAPEHPTLFDKL